MGLVEDRVERPQFCHCEKQRDEAISFLTVAKYEIASSQKALLAMTRWG
jgi:hypothetical protein